VAAGPRRPRLGGVEGERGEVTAVRRPLAIGRRSDRRLERRVRAVVVAEPLLGEADD
jgi:hypothetical protein